MCRAASGVSADRGRRPHGNNAQHRAGKEGQSFRSKSAMATTPAHTQTSAGSQPQAHTPALLATEHAIAEGFFRKALLLRAAQDQEPQPCDDDDDAGEVDAGDSDGSDTHADMSRWLKPKAAACIRIGPGFQAVIPDQVPPADLPQARSHSAAADSEPATQDGQPKRPRAGP
jgi:hypothetical protein